MEVNEKLTFSQYWDDPRFQTKKVVLNGSKKQLWGDNIYHKDEIGNWIQENSHHSFENGIMNPNNVKKDTASNNVLISKNFYYFGSRPIKMPNTLHEIPKRGRNYKRTDLHSALGRSFFNWLQTYNKGINSFPTRFYELSRYPYT